MKSVVIYDSQYGNTARIAAAIASVLQIRGEVSTYKVGEIQADQMTGVDMLVVGSPTQRFKPTAGLNEFLGSLPKHVLHGTRVAAFDTRLTSAEIEKSPPLPFFVKMFGFAAGRIVKQLRSKGGEMVVLPEGFFVQGMEGPLAAGELERAAEWAGRLFA